MPFPVAHHRFSRESAAAGLPEKVKGFERPDVSREQYATPATVAAGLPYFAFMNGDPDGSVADLATGDGRYKL